MNIVYICPRCSHNFVPRARARDLIGTVTCERCFIDFHIDRRADGETRFHLNPTVVESMPETWTCSECVNHLISKRE